MIRRLAMVLSCMLVTTTVAGCGASKTEQPAASNAEPKTTVTQPSTKDIKLTVSWWGNQTRNERTQAALDLYAEQNPGITFDGQFAEWADYWNKLATASAGRNLPDIVQMDYRYIQQYVSNDLLVDLKPYVDSGVIDLSNAEDGIVASGSVDGGIYALCIGVNAPSLLYNKTLLDENGIQVKDNMTIDEFMDLCREIYEKTGYKTNIAYNGGDSFIEYMMRGMGVQLFEEGKLGASSAEQFEEFFRLYEIGISEGWHVNPSIFAEITIGSVEQDPLVYGSSPETKSWCGFFFSNQLTAMQNAAPEGTEIGITTWPSPAPKTSNYLKPSQFFSISVDSKNPEESAKVLDYWTNSIEANDILLGERGVPLSSEVAKAIAPKLNATTNLVIDYINNVVTPNCSPINPPAPDRASEVNKLIDQLQERLCYGQIDAKQAAKELFEEGNKIMGR